MGRTWVARGSSSRAGSALGALAQALAWVLAAALPLACSARPSTGGPRSTTRTQTTEATASDGGELFSFPEVTRSPLGVAQVPASLAPFFSQCRAGDAALARVAERFARRQAEGSAPLDVSEISFALRAEGSPYVWPRAWTLEGGDLENDAAVERMHGWLGSFDDGGERRCGVALASTRDRHVLAAVAVDALADLAPLPVQVRTGTWVDVNASQLRLLARMANNPVLRGVVRGVGRMRSTIARSSD